MLIERSRGRFVSLLHDDDRLLPQALATLLRPLLAHPEAGASFGKSLAITHEGARITHGPDVNEWYYRTADVEGVVNARRAALLTMFPNNSWLARRDLVLSARYDHDHYGTSVDHAFALALSERTPQFYFVDQYVNEVRATRGSVGDTSTGAYYHAATLFRILARDDRPDRDLSLHLDKIFPVAIGAALRVGDFETAARWSRSERHRFWGNPLGWIRRTALAHLGLIGQLAKTR